MGENVVDFFSASAEEFASAYDKDPDFHDRLSLWKDALEEFSPGVRSAIDLGCGPGLFSFHLASLGIQVTGLDAAEGMIRLCQERVARDKLPGCSFQLARLPDLPAGLKKVDLIISSSVLEYVPEFEQSIKKIHSLLEKGGLFLFSLPNAKSLYRKWEKLRFSLTGTPEYYAFVKNILSAEDCVAQLERWGFRCERITYYAHANRISRLGRLFLGEARTENLFLGVFRKI